LYYKNFTDLIHCPEWTLQVVSNPKEKKHRVVKSALLFLFTGANDIYGGGKQRFTGIRFFGRNGMPSIKMTQYK
jgi:hypothetical protein